MHIYLSAFIERYLQEVFSTFSFEACLLYYFFLHVIKHGLDWIGKTWTGLVKHGLIKHGVIKHGLIEHGVIN